VSTIEVSFENVYRATTVVSLFVAPGAVAA
jgi:hypothetical protein